MPAGSVVLLAPHPACCAIDASQLANAAAVQSVDRHNVTVVSDSNCLLPYPTSISNNRSHQGSLACAVGQRLADHYVLLDDASTTGEVDCARPKLGIIALCSEVTNAFTDALCSRVLSESDGLVCVSCPTSELARRVVARLSDKGCNVAAGIEVGSMGGRPSSTIKVSDPKSKGAKETVVPVTEVEDSAQSLMSICGLNKGPQYILNGAAPTFPPESIVGLARTVAAVLKQVPLPGISWSQRVVVESTAAPAKGKAKGNVSARGVSPSQSPVDPSTGNDLSSKLVAVQAYLYLSPDTEVVVSTSMERYLNAITVACTHYFESALSGAATSGPNSERNARFAALAHMQSSCAGIAHSATVGSPQGGDDKPPSTKGTRPTSQSVLLGRGPSLYDDHFSHDPNATQGQQFVNASTRMQHAATMSMCKGDSAGQVDDFLARTTAERQAIVALMAEVSAVLSQLRSHRRELIVSHYFPQLSAAPPAKGKVVEKGPYTRGSQVLAALGPLVSALSEACPSSSRLDRLVGGLLSGACAALFEFTPLTSTRLEAATAAAAQAQNTQGKQQQQQATTLSQAVAQATAAADNYDANVERFFETQSALFGRLVASPILPKVPSPTSTAELLPLHTCLFFHKHKALRRSLGSIQAVIYQLDALLQSPNPTGVNIALRLISPTPMGPRQLLSGEPPQESSQRAVSVAHSSAEGDVEVTAEAANVAGSLAVVQVSIPASRKGVDDAVTNGLGIALTWLCNRPNVRDDSLPRVNITHAHNPSLRLSGPVARSCIQLADTAVAVSNTRATRSERTGAPDDDDDEGSRYLLELVDVESNNLRRISRGLARARLGDREMVRRATLAPATDLPTHGGAKRKSMDITAMKPSSRKGGARMVATPTEVLTPAEQEAALRAGNEVREREEFHRVANAEEPLPRSGTLLYERRPDVEARHAIETKRLRTQLKQPRKGLSKLVVGAFFDATFGSETEKVNAIGLVDDTAPDTLELHHRHLARVRDVCTALSSGGADASMQRQRHVRDIITHPLVPIKDEDSGIVGLLTEYVRTQTIHEMTAADMTKQVIQTVDSNGDPLHIPAAGASEKVLSLVNNTLTPTEQQYLLDQVALEQLVRSGFRTLTPRFSTYCHTIHEDHPCVESEDGFLPPPSVVSKVSALQALFPNNVRVISAGEAVSDILGGGRFPTNGARYSRNSMLNETVGYLAVGLCHTSDAADDSGEGSALHPLASGLQNNEHYRRSAWRSTWGTSALTVNSSPSSKGLLLTADDHARFPQHLPTGGVQLAMSADMSLVGLNEVATLPDEPTEMPLLPSTEEWTPEVRRRLLPRPPQCGTRELILPYDGSAVEICGDASSSSIKWMKDDLVAVHHIGSSPRTLCRFGSGSTNSSPLVTIEPSPAGKRLTVVDADYVSEGSSTPLFAAAAPVSGLCVATTVLVPTSSAAVGSEVSFTCLTLAPRPSEVSRYVEALSAYWHEHPAAASLANQQAVLQAMLYAQSAEYQRDMGRDDVIHAKPTNQVVPPPRQPGKPPVATSQKTSTKPVESMLPQQPAAEVLDFQRLVRHVQHRRHARDGALAQASVAMSALMGVDSHPQLDSSSVVSVVESAKFSQTFNVPAPPSISYSQPLLRAFASATASGVHTLSGFGPQYTPCVDGTSTVHNGTISLLDIEAGRRVCCKSSVVTVDFHSQSVLKIFPDGTTATYLRSIGEHTPSFLSLCLAGDGITASQLLEGTSDEVLAALYAATTPSVSPVSEWISRTSSPDDLSDAMAWVDMERMGDAVFPPKCMRIPTVDTDDQIPDTTKKQAPLKKKGRPQSGGDKSTSKSESSHEVAKTWADELIAPLVTGGCIGPVPMLELPTYWLFVSPTGARVARRGRCIFDECSPTDTVLWRLVCAHANVLFPRHVDLAPLAVATSEDTQNVCTITSREDGTLTAVYKGARSASAPKGAVVGSVRVVVGRDGTVLSSVLPISSSIIPSPSSGSLISIPKGRPALAGLMKFLSTCSVDTDEATPSEKVMPLTQCSDADSFYTTLAAVVEHPQFPRVVLRRHGSEKQSSSCTSHPDASTYDWFVSFRNGSTLSSQLSVPVTAQPLKVVVGSTNNNPATSVAANSVSYGSTSAVATTMNGANLRITAFRHTTGSGLQILPQPSSSSGLAALLLEPWSVALSPSATSRHLWMPASEVALKGLPGVVGGLLLTGGASARSKASAAVGVPAALYEGVGVVTLSQGSPTSPLHPEFRLVDRRNYLTAVCSADSKATSVVFKRIPTEGLVQRMVPAGLHGHAAPRKPMSQSRGTSLSPFRNVSMQPVSRTDHRDGIENVCTALESLECTLRHFAYPYIRLNQLVGSPQVTYFNRVLREADLVNTSKRAEGNIEASSQPGRTLSPTSMTHDSSSVRGLHRAAGAPAPIPRDSTEELGYLRYDCCPLVFAIRKGGTTSRPLPTLSQLLTLNDVLTDVLGGTTQDGSGELFDAVAGALGVEGSGKRIASTTVTSRTGVAGEPNVEQLHFFEASRGIPSAGDLPSPHFAAGPTPISLWLPKSMLPPKRLLAAFQALADPSMSATQSAVKRQLLLFRSYDSSVRDTLAAILLYDAAKRRSMQDYAESVLTGEARSSKATPHDGTLAEKYKSQLQAVARGVPPSKVALLAPVDGRLSVMTETVEEEVAHLGDDPLSEEEEESPPAHRSPQSQREAAVVYLNEKSRRPPCRDLLECVPGPIIDFGEICIPVYDDALTEAESRQYQAFRQQQGSSLLKSTGGAATKARRFDVQLPTNNVYGFKYRKTIKIRNRTDDTVLAAIRNPALKFDVRGERTLQGPVRVVDGTNIRLGPKGDTSVTMEVDTSNGLLGHRLAQSLDAIAQSQSERPPEDGPPRRYALTLQEVVRVCAVGGVEPITITVTATIILNRSAKDTTVIQPDVRMLPP